MVRILFICHGNICRSPMAEMVMKELIRKAKADIFVDSAATSTEEIGNGIHRGTRKILTEKGIPFTEHTARQMTKADYDRYDFLIGMDEWNRANMMRILKNDPEGKCRLLLDFCGGGEVADPWYTGDFEATYRDIDRGCRALLAFLSE